MAHLGTTRSGQRCIPRCAQSYLPAASSSHLALSSFCQGLHCQLQNGLEGVLDAVLEVAHAAILSAYSRELAHGSESCTRLPATW
jgi:hypothetical protein